jgi:lipoyl(octanoyl) transferase
MIMDLGISSYEETLRLQRGLADLRNIGRINDSAILVEHPDVYTEGRHTLPEDSMQGSISVERGGSITYHGPGQLVHYYIINMKERGKNVREIIELIHDCTITLLSSYGLKGISQLGKETGVWVGSRKIASTGIAVIEFTTLHGSALNVSTDLSKFYHIHPCGFNPSIMTSMEKETGRSIAIDKVKAELRTIISEKMKI